MKYLLLLLALGGMLVGCEKESWDLKNKRLMYSYPEHHPVVDLFSACDTLMTFKDSMNFIAKEMSEVPQFDTVEFYKVKSESCGEVYSVIDDKTVYSLIIYGKTKATAPYHDVVVNNVLMDIDSAGVMVKRPFTIQYHIH